MSSTSLENRSTVTIVGAGISGLSLAWELKKKNIRFVLLESSQRCGGLLSTLSTDGYRMESAASSFIDRLHGVFSLSKELEIPLLESSESIRDKWIYIDQKLQAIPRSTKELLTCSLLSWRAKFRALTEPLQPTHPNLDESIADFCRRRLGNEVTRILIAPFVTSVFGGDAEELSLLATMPQLAKLEKRGGLARGIAATKVEAIFSTMQSAASGLKQSVRVPESGVETLVLKLQEKLRPHIQLGQVVSGLEQVISPETDHQSSIPQKKRIPRYRVHLANGSQHHTDIVVLATPAYVTASLVAPLDKPMAAALREIPYAAMAVVGLGYNAMPSLASHGHGFITAKGEGLRILEAVFESNLWKKRTPQKGQLIRCLMGGVRDPKLLESSDQEIIALALKDLKTTVGLQETPSTSKVIRRPNAIPQYTIGHRERLAIIRQGEERLQLFLAGNYQRGVSVNDCIASSRKIAHAIEKRLENS